MADDFAQASKVVEQAAVPSQEAVNESAEASKSVDELIADGNAATAAGKHAEASEHFAFAVEKLVEKHGELAIETVDVLEAYGNALLRNAIATSAVLPGGPNKKLPEGDAADATATATATATASGPPTASSSKPAASTSASAATKEKASAAPSNDKFHFGGDAPSDEEDGAGDAEENEGAGGEAEGEGEGEEGDEQGEDDYASAWNALDQARATLVKVFAVGNDNDSASLSAEQKRERELQLARIHTTMAEVASEEERFSDSVTEYQAALAIQTRLLPPWDRLVAQTHLFIALALEMVPNSHFGEESAEEKDKTVKKSFEDAIAHVGEAKRILGLRKNHILGYPDETAPLGASQTNGDSGDVKGKGKAKESEVEKLEPQKKLSEKDEDELKDIDELSGELDLKMDDLKQMAKDAEKPLSLQEQLSGSDRPQLPEGVSREVNDLSSMVKKKKKPAQLAGQPAPAPASATVIQPTETTIDVGTAGALKRKAEDELKKDDAPTEGEADKKTRVEA